MDLERGPTGFGFSLRGGSEYNMGLYVLGLMEGGPAQRSNKIQVRSHTNTKSNEFVAHHFLLRDVVTLYLPSQVSDQLVEINGDSTSGMTHSQAVEQIRRGGHRIHLVLKKGNGYVPDYGETRLWFCTDCSKLCTGSVLQRQTLTHFIRHSGGRRSSIFLFSKSTNTRP